MTIMSRIVQIAAMALAVMPCGAKAEPASAWTDGFHSRVRLVSGGYQDGRLLAGIEIRLDPGFKTYWRDPGESGLPPRFEWSGSENVAGIDLRWPAPERSEDAAGVAHGYHDRVVFPVILEPKDAARPVMLAVTIDYGVCKEICIPAHADLALPLSADTAERPALQAWLDRVPRPQPLGAPGALSVLSVEPAVGDKPTLTIAVRAPEGPRPALFVEGPENWYFSTASSPTEGRFLVTIDEKPKDATGDIPLRLTLVAGSHAVESSTRLDASRLSGH
jgi:DsbC/DsbD-like thiol-disulfide interchange protein